MIYFGRKWLTGDVYRELSHDGAKLTPEIIAGIMGELRRTKVELERVGGDAVVTGCT